MKKHCTLFPDANKHKGGHFVKPFVVSADIVALLQEWARTRGFVVPDCTFFTALRREFCAYMEQIFPRFEFIEEKELKKIHGLAAEFRLPAVTLERAYSTGVPWHRLEMTRLVDLQGNPAGFGERIGSPPLEQQFERIGQKLGGRQVVLADEVIFTGKSLKHVIDLLARLNVQVRAVVAGIAMANGVEFLNHSLEVRCLRLFHGLRDQVCERDFYLGLPLAGKVITGSKERIPYLLPFGKMGEWASIPAEWQELLSQFCIGQSIELFREIEHKSHKRVRCADIDPIASLPTDDTPLVERLERLQAGR